MGRFSGKTCRLASMLALTFSFFLVELIYGHITNSLALIGDSYHMLSDVVALVVGIASVRISKLRSRKNTYGWARAEVLGALVNAVFLIALCFTIFVEAIQRLSAGAEIEHEDWMLYVGIAGLVVNLIGLLLFHQHSHGHGHGHSHGGGGSKHSHGGNHTHENDQNIKEGGHGHSHEAAVSNPEKVSLNIVTETKSAMEAETADAANADAAEEDTEEVNIDAIRGKPKMRSGSQLNMKGVFLHVLGDALGSVVVIVSALVIKFVEADWKYKIDPVLSMVMVMIILSTTVPLLKESALILLQTVPTHIQVAALKDKLVNEVDGVLAVHEFHVWQLAGNRIIASAHIRCHNLRDYMRIAEEVKSFFHNEGIHSTTIQPEFVETSDFPVQSSTCLLDCICMDEVKCCPERSRQSGHGVKLTSKVTADRSLKESQKKECAVISKPTCSTAVTVDGSGAQLPLLPICTGQSATGSGHTDCSSSEVKLASSPCNYSSSAQFSTHSTACLVGYGPSSSCIPSADISKNKSAVEITVSSCEESACNNFSNNSKEILNENSLSVWQPSAETLQQLRDSDKCLHMAIKRLSRDLEEIRGEEINLIKARESTL